MIGWESYKWILNGRLGVHICWMVYNIPTAPHLESQSAKISGVWGLQVLALTNAAPAASAAGAGKRAAEDSLSPLYDRPDTEGLMLRGWSFVLDCFIHGLYGGSKEATAEPAASIDMASARTLSNFNRVRSTWRLCRYTPTHPRSPVPENATKIPDCGTHIKT